MKWDSLGLFICTVLDDYYIASCNLTVLKGVFASFSRSQLLLISEYLLDN